MEVAVLGPVEARINGSRVDLGTPKQRALFAALALSAPRPVSVDALVDLLWGDSPPPTVSTTLHAYISGLRRVLEPDRAKRAPATVLVTAAPGYALELNGSGTDAALLEEAVTRAHQRLSAPEIPSADLAEIQERLATALGLWRGTPFAELGDAPAAQAVRARLEDLRLLGLEDRAVAALGLGQHGTVAAELEALTALHPLRERLWALRAVALARSGRQADALTVIATVRELLADELGLELSSELRELQTAILRQDGALERPLVMLPPPGPTGSGGAVPPETSSALVSISPWPLEGRDQELATLVTGLDAAMTGRPGFVVLTGEPGIGKTRLCREVAEVGRERGGRVLVGRGSQDDGAPPLRMWTSVLEGLGEQLPQVGDDDGAGFRLREHIVRTVREAARERLTLLILDDLHWADAGSLQVLRLLVESLETERLQVVATWRPHPPPSEALADVAEALARRHATRLELSGLASDSVLALFGTVADTALDPGQADALWHRTEGNPFFVVEYARLSGAHGGQDTLLSDDPPRAVQEVIAQRIARLPGPTVRLLRAASVIGRAFDSATLAAATGTDEDDLLDLVEPAQAAGLVREEGVDRFAFAHALVRDTAYGGVSASRRARLHALVAQSLDGISGRETELALHWSAAGPAYAGRAWRSAQLAAEVARRVHAHEERVELLLRAVSAMDDDAEATPRDRFDVLMALAEAYRRLVMWPELVTVTEQAIAVGEALGDPDLVALAAISTASGALWQSSGHSTSYPSIVAALRRSLRRLPPADSALRCRVLLALSSELYYVSDLDERRALVDEGLAMARRLADAPLLLDVCQSAYLSLWVPATATERLALTQEAAQLARDLGDEVAAVAVGTQMAVVLGELGRPEEMWRVIAEVEGEAERLRLPYALLVLDTLVIPWLAMAGRSTACARHVERLVGLGSQISLEQAREGQIGAMISQALWQGRASEAADLLGLLVGGPFPITGILVSALWRAGREEEARAFAAEHPFDLDPEDWCSMLAWCFAGESALYLQDGALGAATYARLAPYAGRSCCAGSGLASGPVDYALAMAAAASGELEVAGRHADDALELAERWNAPLAAQFLRDQRRRFSF
ncbi:BTAD domain-containing putative transcriptional regulator [Nocardioides sp.]|uniref:BTAD domain-containing putative transcriptional regulator n=1 Tax=Nocardioides sp. TaxID=35761 RepID=UPI002735EB5C|nr:BTAD domain-containing putative transcriptional regulator [Nocardioides sp.]MDP3893387.1 BTAD domain-containing putative transcriptional regulator [Nocardioides sp.]